MSPEQAEGKPVTRKSDIYSLGVCLYQMLTGRLPFVGRSCLDVMRGHRFALPEPVKLLNPEVPGRVAQIVESMMEKDPAKRVSSAAEVILLINSACGKGAISTEDQRQPKAAVVEAVKMRARHWSQHPFRIALWVILSVVLGWAIVKVWYGHFTSPEYKYRRGLDAFKSGHYSKAKTHFEAVVYHHPDDPLATKAEERLRMLTILTQCVLLEDERKKGRNNVARNRYHHAMRDFNRGSRDEAFGSLRNLARDYRDAEYGRKAAEKLKQFTGEDVAPPETAKPPQQSVQMSYLQDQLYQQAQGEVRMGEREEGVALLIRLAVEFPEAEVAKEATDSLTKLGELPPALSQ
jgi:hypothetical protein